jgi:hypothetical protein
VKIGTLKSNAYSLYGEYYFREANKRWFVGEQVGIQNFTVSNDQEQLASAADFQKPFAAYVYGLQLASI